MRTKKQCIDSLRHGREVYFKGQCVPDVTSYADIRLAIEHAAIDFEMTDSREHRALAVYLENGKEFSRYFKLPRNSEDLLARSQLIETATALGGMLVVLVRQIRTDAWLCTLWRTRSMGARAGTISIEYRNSPSMFGKQGYRKKIANLRLEAYVVSAGANGAFMLYPKPIRNYRDRLTIDGGLWPHYWFGMVNRGVMPQPYGWDEQCTISVQHTDSDIDKHLAAFEDFSPALAEAQQRTVGVGCAWGRS